MLAQALKKSFSGILFCPFQERDGYNDQQQIRQIAVLLNRISF